MACSRGDVVLVRFPFTDLTSVKARPAVILSTASYHREQPDLVVAALTSNVAAATGALDFTLYDWQAAGLRFPTAFKPVVATLEPSMVLHRIGSLSPVDQAEVDKRLRAALGL